MTKRMTIMLIACLIVFGGLFGMQFMGKQAMNDYFDNMPQPPVTVSSTRAQVMEWPNNVHSVGSLVPAQGVDVTSEAEGTVETIHFSPGTTVTQGQLLVSLEASSEKAQLKQLRAQAEIARLNARRAEDLAKRKALSQSELDQARAEHQAAAAAADAQAARVAKREIRAPFTGQLGIRQINLGQFIGKGTKLVTLQSVDPMEVEFGLPEWQYSQIQAGMPVQVWVEAYPGETFTGELTVVEPRVEADTRNFRMRASLPNSAGKLRAGMFGRVDILRPGNTTVLAVPRTAIKYDSYGSSVFVIAKNEDDPDKLTARHRFIKTGASRGDFIAVTEGLEEGEQIAATGLLKLRNGATVIIDDSTPPKLDTQPDVADT